MPVANIEVRTVPNAGRGLFAITDIDLKTHIASVNNITVKALDDARLKDTCYHCQVSPQAESSITALKLCSGCKIVRYCSAKCQKISWVEVHRYECKIFRNLAPRVLPSNVRAVMRFLLLQKAGKLMPGEFDEVISLHDHLNRFQEAGGEVWQDLCLSAKAAKVYSGTKLDELIVRRLCGVLMTNSFTMTTPTCDAVGVALHPFAALFNHSCDNNSVVRFDHGGCMIEVVPLRCIREGEEITISYIEELLPLEERQDELKRRYFFTCRCARCTRESSSNRPPRSPTAQSAYKTATALLSAPSNDAEHINSALLALDKSFWEATSYPMPSLRQQLVTTYLDQGEYSLAFVHAMIQSFQLDPILYQATHHPIRRVHAWLCVRIMDHLLDVDTKTQTPQRRQESFSLAPFAIDVDFWRQAIVVSLHHSAKLVAPDDFSRMIDARYDEDKTQWHGNDKAYQEQFVEKAVLEAKWAGVQNAINAVMQKESSKS